MSHDEKTPSFFAVLLLQYARLSPLRKRNAGRAFHEVYDYSVYSLYLLWLFPESSCSWGLFLSGFERIMLADSSAGHFCPQRTRIRVFWPRESHMCVHINRIISIAKDTTFFFAAFLLFTRNVSLLTVTFLPSRFDAVEGLGEDIYSVI